MHSIATPGLWIVFAIVVFAALAVDFLVLRSSGAHRVAFREALLWSLGWIALALAFNGGLWWWLDAHVGREVAHEVGLEFLTGYVVEKTLAVDNIFVFLMVFNYFAVPAEQRQRASDARRARRGRAACDPDLRRRGAGRALPLDPLPVRPFLVVTGAKMLLRRTRNPIWTQIRSCAGCAGTCRLTREFRGEALSVIEHGKRYYTPMFVVLVLIAVTDVIFAVDSIPAIFAVTLDPFIVLTSNVFAVLGLRAMFFMLAGMADRFHLLGQGLAAVLLFVGTKMLIAGFYKIPIGVALGVVALLIAGSIAASLWLPRRRADN